MAQAFLDGTTVRVAVERRFQVYDAQVEGPVATFYINVDQATLEERFEDLRQELREQSLVPLIRYHGGEHSIHVVAKPEGRGRGNRVNLVLFALTWITTTLAGAQLYFGYAHANLSSADHTLMGWFAQVFSPVNFLWGFVLFALPLMLILGIHEMGHYYMTKRHGMEASLPYFIPLPPFFTIPIGTMGAFISMREPIPNRKALLDIGASGPIAGFVVAVPVMLIGMILMKVNAPVVVDPAGAGSVSLGLPLLYQLLALPFGFLENQMIHPTALAGWVGLFVTAINLLPAGQLDGGHIASALFGERARYASYGAIALLLVLGFGIPFLPAAWGLGEGYSGWLLFALLISFLGLRHPPTLNSLTPLDPTRRFIAIATFSLLLLCFTPVPLSAGG